MSSAPGPNTSDSALKYSKNQGRRMPWKKEMMCVHAAGFSLEGGASPGNEEEEDECCEMRPWPHTGLVGDDKCFLAAQREKSQGFRI